MCEVVYGHGRAYGKPQLLSEWVVIESEWGGALVSTASYDLLVECSHDEGKTWEKAVLPEVGTGRALSVPPGTLIRLDA